MKESRFAEAQFVAILGDVKKGDLAIAELCRVHGIAESAFCRWRRRCGDMQVSEVRRLRELEAENACLKRVLAERSHTGTPPCRTHPRNKRESRIRDSMDSVLPPPPGGYKMGRYTLQEGEHASGQSARGSRFGPVVAWTVGS